MLDLKLKTEVRFLNFLTALAEVLYKREEPKACIVIENFGDCISLKLGDIEWRIDSTDFFYGIPCFQLSQKLSDLNKKSLIKDFYGLSLSNKTTSDFRLRLENYHHQIKHFVDRTEHQEILMFNPKFSNGVKYLGLVYRKDMPFYLDYKRFKIDYCFSFNNHKEIVGKMCHLYFTKIDEKRGRVISILSFEAVGFNTLDLERFDLFESHYDVQIEIYQQMVQIIETCIDYGFPCLEKEIVYLGRAMQTWFTDFKKNISISWNLTFKYALKDALLNHLSDIFFSFFNCNADPRLRNQGSYQYLRPIETVFNT
jgi:hypothetical protein